MTFLNFSFSSQQAVKGRCKKKKTYLMSVTADMDAVIVTLKQIGVTHETQVK